MKILWISNRRLDIEKKNTFGGGWLTALMNSLISKKDVELHIAYIDRKLKVIKKTEVQGIFHYGIPRKKNVLKYDRSLEHVFGALIDSINPDIIHAQGTENANAIAAMRSRPNRTYVVSIQGLLGRYAEHYASGIPLPYCLDLTLRDLVHWDGPISKGRKFARSSWYENEMIERADYIMARTRWDTACVKHINREVMIYNDLRVLRPSFYQHKWSFDKCIKHSIFIGNSITPIKGMHFVLKALPLILKVFPDTRLYVSSPDFTKINSIKDFLNYRTYYAYVKKLIKQNNLSDHIVFMGTLNEDEMCKAFLQSNVFVLPSVIENSPNTLSEAAILGVPCVASFVAGVPDVIEDGHNGFMYAYDEYYIMADCIIKIFQDESLARSFSANIRYKALYMYDRIKNTDLVYDAYKEIIARGNQE